MMTYLSPILIISLLIVLNGLFVAAEFAIIGARRTRIDQLAASGNSAAKTVSHVLNNARHQDRYIAVAQLGITLATVGLGMYGEPSIASWIYGPLEQALGVSAGLAHSIGTVLAVVIMTYFHVTIGEMIPKALALKTPEMTALNISRPMAFMGIVFYPLVSFLNAASNGFLRLLGIPLSDVHGRLYSPEELELLVSESHEGGAIDADQQELIANIFDFSEREVYQLMIPRPRITGVKLSSPLEDIDKLIRESHYSRFPVYDGDLDHIVGIFHVKDFIKQQTKGGAFDLKTLMRRAPRIPEHMSADSLLAAFKRLKVHMAVVMDEYGGTEGIVTLDDLIEEVIGNVKNGDSQEPPDIEVLEDGVLLAHGETLIEDFSEDYNVALESEDADTLAGLILEELGRAPEEGDTVKLDGVELSAYEVDGLAIKRVRVVLPHVTEENEASAANAPNIDEAHDI